MKDEAFRKALEAYCRDRGISAAYLTDASYDRSIVGITDEGRVVYDYRSMVLEFMSDENCSEEEAIEWLDYNTMRAIPYMGELAPIVIMDTRADIMDAYFEGAKKGDAA